MGAIIESEIDMLCINRDMANAMAEAFARTISNRHRAVSIVNILVTRRHFLNHQRPQLQSEIANFTIIGFEKLPQGLRGRSCHDCFSNSYCETIVDAEASKILASGY